MASDALTVEALDECLKELVHWEMVATHLPEMTQADIEFIKKDNPGNTGIQKFALYNKWLRLYTKGTWEDVIKALEIEKENTLAENIKRKLNVCKMTTKEMSNTEKLTEQIDEEVVIELRQLSDTFEALVESVEKRCIELVASNKISVSDIIRPLQRSQNTYKVSGLQNIQTTDQLFESLSCHYTFLDCDKLFKVVAKLPDSTDLLSNVEDHKKSIMSFKRTTHIRNLKNKLKPYIRDARLNEISLGTTVLYNGLHYTVYTCIHSHFVCQLCIALLYYYKIAILLYCIIVLQSIIHYTIQ